ncbi:hypothetical protein [Microlunatus soli]|uniref:DUF5602 domain-containing protein n=1 Tax=Microlunatus soli TaxID=630515 RepID=A0A1H1UBS9_9ACTN|nr:hypothetical protein [Microlunatus soli]SDS69955.1 hypothetical protein SAMN04489812_2722 [Microlunatus soli]
MRLRLTAIVAAVLLFAGVTAVPPATANPSSGLQRLCLVNEHAPNLEHTVRVPSWMVDRLIEKTLSYRGPCAEYGDRAPLGAGEQVAYTQRVGSRPIAVGWRVDGDSLQGLPTDPPNAGLWCYDKNGDGTTDRMTECTGGYETKLDLSDRFTDAVHSQFSYVLNNWNPMGHMPPHVYDLPHFDVHFYLNDNAERLAIRPGPCPALVNCEDYKLGKDLPDDRYVAPDYADLDAVEPAMGNHLIDPTGPEFNGERFTHTFIYGSWDDEITFYEPMITHEWLAGVADGTQQSACYPMKLPDAWQQSGWFPTRYCIRDLDNRDELSVSMEGFVYRQAA